MFCWLVFACQGWFVAALCAFVMQVWILMFISCCKQAQSTLFTFMTVHVTFKKGNLSLCLSLQDHVDKLEADMQQLTQRMTALEVVAQHQAQPTSRLSFCAHELQPLPSNTVTQECQMHELDRLVNEEKCRVLALCGSPGMVNTTSAAITVCFLASSVWQTALLLVTALVLACRRSSALLQTQQRIVADTVAQCVDTASCCHATHAVVGVGKGRFASCMLASCCR